MSDEAKLEHTAECRFGHWMATNYRAVQHAERHLLRFAFYGGAGETLTENIDYVCPACNAANSAASLP